MGGQGLGRRGRRPLPRPGPARGGSPHLEGSSPSACTFEPHPRGSYLQGHSGVGSRVPRISPRGLGSGRGQGSERGWQESPVSGCRTQSWWQRGSGERELRSGDGGGVLSPKNKLELGVRGAGVKGEVSGVRVSAEGVLFLRCFFLVLRHAPGTPGTGLTSLLLTGGGCRMGLGARVRHTGSPAAHSRIPVIPARAGWTGPVPFKFFTGSAGTLRGEKRP